MSEENLESFNRGLEAWNRRDLEGYLELADPEVEWYPGASRVQGSGYNGHDGQRRFWADVFSNFDELTLSFDEVREVGETVVGLGRLRGRSKQGVPIDSPYGLVLRYREGRVISGSDWFSHAEALEAAGLSE